MRIGPRRQRGFAWRGPLLVLFVLLLVAVFMSAAEIRQRLALPVYTGDETLVVVIAPGTPFRRVAQQLADDGGYPYPRLLSWYARWRGATQNIQAGEYAIASQTTVDGILEQLTSGKVLQYSVTAIEGWTFGQFLTELAAHPKLTQTLTGLDDAAIMAALGHPGEHPEGRFFPDTYAFARGTSDLAVLERAYTTMAVRLAEVWAERDRSIPLREPYEALILASIIEKETARADERRQIGGVFVRRLKIGMRLQTDPTVIYGLGDGYDGNITRRDLRTDTPYNTYTRGGLPPTPIALPGLQSLEAAVRPLAGDSLYFVATGDANGSHYFSVTLAEHERAVGRYLDKIRRSGPTGK